MIVNPAMEGICLGGRGLWAGYGQSLWPPKVVLAHHSPAMLAILNLPNTKITAGLHQSFFQANEGPAKEAELGLELAVGGAVAVSGGCHISVP